VKGLQIKPGATLRLPGTLTDDDGVAVDLTGYTLSSQVRTRGTAELVATATVTPDADQTTNPGRFVVRVEASATEDWSPGVDLALDIRIEEPGSDVDITETVLVTVLRAETRA
jgi:hypothetical protein